MLEAALWLADMDRGGVWLLGSGAAPTRVALQIGLSDGAARLLEGCPIGLLSGGPSYWGRGTRAEPHLEELRRLEGLGPMALLPIRHGPRLLGALLVGSGGGQLFPARAREAAEFVAAAAGAVIGHKLGELALQDSEAALQALIENTDSAIALMDRERRLLTFNASFAEAVREICGSQVRLGAPIEEFLRDDVWQWLDPRHRRALAGARLREEVAIAVGSETRHWGVTFNPVVSGGKVTGVSIYSLDITQRRRTERQLLEKEDLLSRVLETLDEGVVVLDRDFRCTYMNAAMERICGRPREEALKPDVPPWETWPHLAQTGADRAMRRAMGGERSEVEEAPYTLEDGTGGFTTEVYLPLRAGGKRASGIVGIIREVTRRRRAEEALRALPRRLVRAQEQERQRVSRELHDEIGQVLTAVKISLQRLKCTEEDPRLADIDVGIEQIDRAIDGVRDLSISLRPLHLDVLGLGPAIRAHIERLTREGGPRAEVSVPAVGVRLPFEVEIACFRIVQEAVTNALRHAQAQRLWVGVEVVEGELRLSVRDDGSGFDTEAAWARIDTGQSLGLRSMHERADLLGGRIEIHSGGAGSEVVAWLPLGRPDATASGGRPPEENQA